MAIRLDTDKAKLRGRLQAAIRELEKPERAAARAKRRQERRNQRKALEAARAEAPMERQRDPRQEDPQYLAWIRGLKCIGCMQDGTPSRSIRSEAAHVRYGDAAAGWSHTGKGQKPHDRRCLPLCHGHHRTGPKAQHAGGERAWWAARAIDPPTLCAALVEAYEAGADGNAVIRQFIDRTRPILKDPNHGH